MNCGGRQLYAGNTYLKSPAVDFEQRARPILLPIAIKNACHHEEIPNDDSAVDGQKDVSNRRTVVARFFTHNWAKNPHSNLAGNGEPNSRAYEPGLRFLVVRRHGQNVEDNCASREDGAGSRKLCVCSWLVLARSSTAHVTCVISVNTSIAARFPNRACSGERAGMRGEEHEQAREDRKT